MYQKSRPNGRLYNNKEQNRVGPGLSSSSTGNVDASCPSAPLGIVETGDLHIPHQNDYAATTFRVNPSKVT